MPSDTMQNFSTLVISFQKDSVSELLRAMKRVELEYGKELLQSNLVEKKVRSIDEFTDALVIKIKR